MSCNEARQPGCVPLAQAALSPGALYPSYLPQSVRASTASVSFEAGSRYAVEFQIADSSELSLIVRFGRASYDDLNEALDHAVTVGEPLHRVRIGRGTMWCGAEDIDDECFTQRGAFTFFATSHTALSESLTIGQVARILASARPIKSTKAPNAVAGRSAPQTKVARPVAECQQSLAGGQSFASRGSVSCLEAREVTESFLRDGQGPEPWVCVSERVGLTVGKCVLYGSSGSVAAKVTIYGA